MKRPKSITVLLLLIALGLSSCTTKLAKTDMQKRKVAVESTETPNYPEIFTQVRELFKLSSQTARRSQADPAETPFIEAIQKNPEMISANKAELIKEIAQESAASTDPTKHLRLIPPKGQPGYQDLHYYASHPYYTGGGKKQLAPASNLVAVWSQFLDQAEKQIILNVFDFDLQVVADVLVKKAKAGLTVIVGIDKGTIQQRPEVKKIAEFLLAGGVQVTQVNSVSLNHQKMAALDWDDVSKAKVLFSSGNLTQSCLGAEGDLMNLPADQRPNESIPNANHVITMKSWLLANLVHHEATKTLDPNFLYRGSQFPTTGSYQVTGPGVDPQTLEAYPENSMVITFTPGGAYRNVNKNIIAHFVDHSEGSLRMMQFAYSSPEVANSIRQRAIRDFQNTGHFDFRSVGDTPFALQSWSQFLKMSGLEVVTDRKMKKSYESLPSNEWNQALTPGHLKQLRKNVKIAPAVYGNHNVTVDDKNYAVTAKIHHKILTTGPYAIVGTSFNFSANAENNNEQILVFKDKELVQFANGMVDWMFEQSPRSVYKEAQRRNSFGASVEDSDAAGVETEDGAVKPDAEGAR